MMIPVLPDVSDARPEGQIPMDGGRRRLPKFREACLRCSMLWPDPVQRARIVDIRDNIIARIAAAEREGWLGEAEGLQITLAGANDKLAQIARRVPRTVDLPMPTATTGPRGRLSGPGERVRP